MNNNYSRVFVVFLTLLGVSAVLAGIGFVWTLQSNGLWFALIFGLLIIMLCASMVITRMLQKKFQQLVAAEQLQAHMKRIRELEKMRSEFVANVSHELKTPVAAVKGFAETLLSGAMNNKETAEQFLHIIFDESNRLDRLIGDLTELSKIESGRSPLHFSPLSINELLSDVLRIMQTMAQEKDISLNMKVEEGLFIEADEDRLRQILFNLISNGINYTPEGGTVEIAAQSVKKGKDHEFVQMVISDTGMGIPEKDLPRIFERFYRVDKARSRRSGGTGLGLSIVKHLIELHKGTIQAESKLGEGTKFTIELPMLQP